MIIPAATVALVCSSIRMKLPVVRLRRYWSKKRGRIVRSVTRPISFRAERSMPVSRCRVLTSKR